MRIKILFTLHIFFVCINLLFADNADKILKLNFKKAIQIGIINNYDLKYNKIEQLLTKKIIAEKWRLFLPTFSLDYGNSINVIPYEQDSRLHTIKFKVSQPIYQGGRYYASYKIAQFNHKIKRELYSVILNNVKANIQKQYFALIIQKEIVNIQKRLVEHANIQLNFAREENKLGMLTSIDLAEIEAYVKNTELDYIKAKNQLSQEYNKLKKVLYIEWQRKIVIDETIISNFTYFELKKSLKELITFAYNKRKDLINMYSELIKSYYDYKSNKYYYLPAISLNFEYNLSGEKFYPFKRNWSIGLQFDFLFKGSTLSASDNYEKDLSNRGKTFSSSHSLSPFADIGYIRRYLEAEANLKTVKVKLDQLRQDIAMDVEDKYSSVKENWELLKILKERENVLKKRQEVYNVKLKLGEAKRVDVMEAEIEYYKAQVETVRGILGYINSTIDLELAIGADIGYLNIIKMR